MGYDPESTHYHNVLSSLPPSDPHPILAAYDAWVSWGKENITVKRLAVSGLVGVAIYMGSGYLFDWWKRKRRYGVNSIG
jgi:hypothetical protein